jgi:hypothetical protein
MIFDSKMPRIIMLMSSRLSKSADKIIKKTERFSLSSAFQAEYDNIIHFYLLIMINL